MSISYDKLAFRLSQILIILNNGTKIKACKLSEEFNVSKRTIQRDLNIRLNPLVERDSKNNYYIHPNMLGKFSDKDVNKIITMCLELTNSKNIDKNTIHYLLDFNLKDVFVLNNNLSTKHEKLIIPLSKAILNHMKIQFFYSNKERIVKPYKLYRKNENFYVIADDSKKVKYFNLNKISNFKLLETEKFICDNKIKKEIENNSTNWISEKQQEVILKIHKKEAICNFKNKYVFVQYDILNENEHCLSIKTTISYDNEIINIAKSWLPSMEIVKPLNLREKFNNLLKDYLNTFK